MDEWENGQEWLVEWVRITFEKCAYFYGLIATCQLRFVKGWNGGKEMKMKI